MPCAGRCSGLDEAADQLIAEIDAAAAPPQATFTMDQVMALLQTAKSGGETDIEGLLTKVLSASAKANATAMQTALNRENPNYVAKGPYHRADGSEVRAKYDVFFGPSHSKGKGGRLPKDMWREEEADLINRFQVGDHRTSRNGDWSAECVRDGSTHELIVKVPMFTEDQRNDLPSFAMILRELLDGDPHPVTEVSWSPDGRWIAIHKQQGGSTQVWRADAEATQRLAVPPTSMPR